VNVIAFVVWGWCEKGGHWDGHENGGKRESE